MKSFLAKIQLIGVNPYVLLPSKTLSALFLAAGKNSGSIPVQGTVDGHSYIRYLVKYSGEWRLYLNGITRKAAGKEVGDNVRVTVEFDSTERLTEMPAELDKALAKNSRAKTVFDRQSPSLQKEIKRYINNLKSPEAKERNTKRAIQFLLGKERFVGRPALGKDDG